MTCIAQLSPGDVTSTAMRAAEQESLKLNFKELAGMFKAPKLLGVGFVKHAEVVVEPQTADCAPASKIASSSQQSAQPWKKQKVATDDCSSSSTLTVAVVVLNTQRGKAHRVVPPCTVSICGWWTCGTRTAQRGTQGLARLARLRGARSALG